MKILITGGNGYVAKSIHSGLKINYDVTSISRNDFDLSDQTATCEWFHEREYDVVIHTATSGGSRLKEEDHSVYHNNMKMINNLRGNKDCFNKLITFGSGAEFFHDTPYASSKRDITAIVNNTDNWFNLRIFAVFDENELDTRFIKSNIIRYIKKEEMLIHKDKIMDFFYMKDLISLVDFYIKNDKISKEINCSYNNKFTLIDIANMINDLSDYKVPINVQQSGLDFYCEDSNLPIQTIGLKNGIEETYKKLLHSV